MVMVAEAVWSGLWFRGGGGGEGSGGGEGGGGVGGGVGGGSDGDNGRLVSGRGKFSILN